MPDPTLNAPHVVSQALLTRTLRSPFQKSETEILTHPGSALTKLPRFLSVSHLTLSSHGSLITTTTSSFRNSTCSLPFFKNDHSRSPETTVLPGGCIQSLPELLSLCHLLTIHTHTRTRIHIIPTYLPLSNFFLAYQNEMSPLLGMLC